MIHRLIILCFALLILSPLSAEEKKMIRIDVRSITEFEKGHIAQAIHIPHTEIAKKILPLKIEKNTEIRLYCAAGYRAGLAKKTLDKMGYTKVINEGGYSDLKKSLKDN